MASSKGEFEARMDKRYREIAISYNDLVGVAMYAVDVGYFFMPANARYIYLGAFFPLAVYLLIRGSNTVRKVASDMREEGVFSDTVCLSAANATFTFWYFIKLYYFGALTIAVYIIELESELPRLLWQMLNGVKYLFG